MNEHFSLEIYMARSHSEMQRSGIELAETDDSGRKLNHACMNEHFWLEIYMARSHSEMQRSGVGRHR